MQRTPAHGRAHPPGSGRTPRLRRFALAVLLVSLPGWTFAAGFDCTRATSPIEQAICADDALSLDDFVLTERYQFLVAHCKGLPGASQPVEEQRRWLAQVRGDFAPGDAGREALRASYHQRNAELERDLAACTLRRRGAAPLRIATASNPSGGIQVPWVEAASPDASRRINDTVHGRMLEGPAPATLKELVASLSPSGAYKESSGSASFEVLRNDGRLLVITIGVDGCVVQCSGHFTDRWQFDARTGRELENDTLFTPEGKQALARYFAKASAARYAAALARARQDKGTEPDELEHYEHCVSEQRTLMTMPVPELDAEGHWALPTWGCSFTYRQQWDQLDGIRIPVSDAQLARHLSAYGRTVLLGQGDASDVAPAPPRCQAPAAPPAPGVSPYRSLAFGDGHSLALLADGSVVAWGEDDDGQLGRGQERHDNQAMPPQVVLRGMAAIAAGEHWSAALGADGTLWTWGSNYMGGLGRATPGERIATRPAAMGHDFAQVRAAGVRGLALKRDGSLWTWGGRVDRSFGNGSESYVSTPWRLGEGYVQAEMGPRGDFQALGRDGTLWTWGGNASDGKPLPEDAPRKLGEGFARLAGNGLQAAFKADGSLWAWGGSLAAMLDTDGERDRLPQRVGDGFAQVVGAPDDVVAALKTDGSVWLPRTRGRVTELAQVACGGRRIALVGTSWESLSPSMLAQVVVLHDDGSLLAWPVRPQAAAGADGAAPVRATAAAPLKLGEGFRQLDAVGGQPGNRGPELLAIDMEGRVWQRRFLRGLPPPANPHDWLERVELPQAASTR